jgi:hypothetical protein
VLEPEGTVTLAGTVAAEGVLLLRVTDLPPKGALAVSVTVPVTLVPPTVVVGESVTVEIDWALAMAGTNIARIAKQINLRVRSERNRRCVYMAIPAARHLGHSAVRAW